MNTEQDGVFLMAKIICGKCRGRGKVSIWKRGRSEEAACGSCAGKGVVDCTMGLERVRAWLGLDVPKEA